MHTQPSRQNGCPWRCSEDAGQDHATESTKASCTWPATTDRKSWPQQDSAQQQLRSTTRKNLRSEAGAVGGCILQAPACASIQSHYFDSSAR